MERNFMGLSMKEPLIVVTEEAGDDYKDLGYPKSSGVSWSMSNKVSALPHFMSFKPTQDERIPKVMPNQFAPPVVAALSTEYAFAVKHKLQPGEVQNVHSLHQIPIAQMLPITMSNPFLKTHFAGAAQNFAGATSKQQYVGGVPITAPRSVIPSSNASGTTESWFNTKTSRTPAQLTIFYAGTVNVYEDITPEKAQAIMFLAGTGCLYQNMAQPRHQAQSPPTKISPGDAAFFNQPITQPSSTISSPISVSSHPIVQTSGGANDNDEVKPPKTSCIATNLSNKVEAPKVVTSLGPTAATTMIPSAVPQARKASLARFLEKRKERVMKSAPYILSNKSTGTESNAAGLSASSVVGSSSLSISKD